ncbi:MAG: hypothetical protein IJB02_04410 [Oscillospiraceae bacterium]|nr:hypothetical protein [Oscillospiraceae bacterium]MBQ7000260.1 hypothetical protein [Oscillospiraceae bacterium]
MRRILVFILTIALGLGLFACSNPSSGNLQTGFGRASIMPEASVPLAGGDWTKRYSTGEMDDLSITCVALHQQEKTILLYSMDLITATDNFVDLTKATVSKATGVPQENILMNATHTHSAPAIRNDFDGVVEYRGLFFKAAVQAATDAIADLAATEVYYGSTMTEGMAFVRHYLLSDGSYAGSNFGNFKNGEILDHSTEADGELQLVKLMRKDKKDILLMSFPAHATFNGGSAQTKLSADFPGITRAYVEEHADVLAAYFIGAAGDQISRSSIEGEGRFQKGEYRPYGEALGKYAVDALGDLVKMKDAEMALSTVTFTGKSNKEKVEKFMEAKAVVAVAREYGVSAPETIAAARENGFSSYYEANAVKNRVSAPPTRSMELRVMKLGNLGFVFAPYEMFSTQGMYIKGNAKCDMTFIVTNSEGDMGYIPSKKGIEIDCYEACVTDFEPGTAETLAEEFIKLLDALK